MREFDKIIIVLNYLYKEKSIPYIPFARDMRELKVYKGNTESEKEDLLPIMEFLISEGLIQKEEIQDGYKVSLTTKGALYVEALKAAESAPGETQLQTIQDASATIAAIGKLLSLK